MWVWVNAVSFDDTDRFMHHTGTHCNNLDTTALELHASDSANSRRPLSACCEYEIKHNSPHL